MGCAKAQKKDELPVLTITVFAAPSQSIWFPTIIQKLGLDIKHGFQLVVKQKPGPVAYAEYASGKDKVCYCNAPAAVARFLEQGSDITLLWNIFNAEYVIITGNPAVQKASDLEGKKIAADTSTGGWAIGALLLTQNGVDLEKVSIQSAWGAAQAAQLAASRVDALVVSPVEAAFLQSQAPDKYRIIPLASPEIWKAAAAGPGIPAIAMGVWRDWLREPGNLELVRKLYAANVEAVNFAKANPEKAADIISSTVNVKKVSVQRMLETRPQFIRVAPMSEYRDPIRLLTQRLLPEAGILERPLTDAELDAFVGSFKP